MTERITIDGDGRDLFRLVQNVYRVFSIQHVSETGEVEPGPSGGPVCFRTFAEAVNEWARGKTCGPTYGLEFQVVNPTTYPIQFRSCAITVEADDVSVEAGEPFEVRCVATEDIPLRGLFYVDGVKPKRGEWVLAANQANPSENGIYAASEGEWKRDRCDLDLVKSHKAGVIWGNCTWRPEWRRWFPTMPVKNAP